MVNEIVELALPVPCSQIVRPKKLTRKDFQRRGTRPREANFGLFCFRHSEGLIHSVRTHEGSLPRSTDDAKNIICRVNLLRFDIAELNSSIWQKVADTLRVRNALVPSLGRWIVGQVTNMSYEPKQQSGQTFQSRSLCVIRSSLQIRRPISGQSTSRIARAAPYNLGNHGNVCDSVKTNLVDDLEKSESLGAFVESADILPR